MNRTNRRRGKFIQRIRKWNNGMRYRWLWKNTTRRLIEIGIDPNSSHSRKEDLDTIHILPQLETRVIIRVQLPFKRQRKGNCNEKECTTLLFFSFFGKNLKETKINGQTGCKGGGGEDARALESKTERAREIDQAKGKTKTKKLMQQKITSGTPFLP
jgi:hypothetical protein